MGRPGTPRIAVLGGGPAGLEAALYAKALGLSVTLFEQGQPGEYVGRWGFVRMFTPFGMNVTPLGKKTLLQDRLARDLPADTAFQTGREFRDTYLLPLAGSSTLKDAIRPQSAILGVGRSGNTFRLLVRSANNQETVETADAVIDCTGTYTRPNWLGDGGIPAVGELAGRPHVPYWLEDVRGAKKANYAGKSVIVVGGGYSAAGTVCDLMDLAAENQSTWVIWLTRGPRTQPLVRIPNDPLKERDRLAAKANTLATRCDGNLEHHADAHVDEVVCTGPDKGCRITARVGGRVRTWDADKLIANVGYKPDLNLTAELRADEPGYHVIGAKSKGRDSNFLIRDCHEQIRRAFAEIVGNTRLNLYAA